MENRKIILTAFVALAIGLISGYFIFGGNGSTATTAIDPGHETGPDTEQTYTCSMHPQIRQNEPGICPICEMDLIPLEANTSNDPLVLQMTEEAVKLANVQTTTVGGNGVQVGKTIHLSGKVQADERLASSQVAHLPGRIEKLYVTFTGEPVQKGQKLATLYSPELITAQRELLEAVKMKTASPELLEAARNKLRFWKISAETIAAIEQSGEVREEFDLSASEAGIVTKRRVSLGDYVKKGEPLFDLMNLDKVWVLFDAYEEDLAHISVGDRIGFTTPAAPNKVFQTVVTFIDPVINPNTRVASLRAEIANRKGQLKPEMFVAGTLQKKGGAGAQLSVPKSAVLWTGTRSVVYVKVADAEIPSFEYREIEIGEGQGDSYIVVSGLELGDEIVTNGAFTIDAAAQLNNQASMMNKAVLVKKDGNETGPDFTANTSTVFKKQLNELVSSYLLLKDAFVQTDAKAAAIAAKALLRQLGGVDMTLLEGDAYAYWMEQMNVIQEHGEKLVSMEEVEEQRKQFGFMSQALIHSIEAFGTVGEALYVQYCPMAFDNQGGDWIASEEAIKNPYFGDKMMKCGSVKKEFKASQSN